MKTDESRTLKSPQTTFEIVELLMELDGARPTQLAERLDVSPSTVHAHLATLEKKRYVASENGVYDVGMRFMQINSYVRNRDPAYGLAKKYTEQITNETGCRVVFVVEEHGKGTYFHVHSGEYSEWGHTEKGAQFDLHTTAAGKSILANLPAERVDAIVERYGLPQRTEHTIARREELFSELEEVRERGYAINNEEDVRGIRGIGVAVTRESGEVVGAFGIGGPTEKMTSAWGDEELAKIVIGITSEFELELSLRS